MKIVQCRHCKGRLKLPDGFSMAKPARCPGCGHLIDFSAFRNSAQKQKAAAKPTPKKQVGTPSRPQPKPESPSGTAGIDEVFPPCERPADISQLPMGVELLPNELQEQHKSSQAQPPETQVTLNDLRPAVSSVQTGSGTTEDIWAIMQEEKSQRENGYALEESEMIGKSGKPAWLEVLQYPVTGLGVSLFCVFLGPHVVLALLGILASLLPGALKALLLPFILATWLVKFFTTAYMFWYICVSIEMSAKGDRHIPETLWLEENFWASFRRMAHVLGCILICIGPAMVYVGFYGADLYFWAMLLAGNFLLPSGLLAVSLRHSLDGLNPYLMFKMFFKAPPSYIKLVLLFEISVAAVTIFVGLQSAPIPVIIKLVLRFAYIYLLFVLAHLTGRFFYKNIEKLKWLVPGMDD